MKFRLKRQEIDKDLFIFCLNRIKQDKLVLPKAGKKIVQGMSAVLKDIEESGLPSYLRIKKLKGKLGYGVFLHPEAKPISRGALIAPYSGRVLLSPQYAGNDSDYAFALMSNLCLTREEQLKWDPSRRYHPRRLYSVDLDAHKKGNFTRFINHSETPNVEARFVKISSTSKDLPSAPFELIYVAKKMIRPGEQLLVCYEGEDKSYWGALKIKPFSMTPTTFMLDKSGEIVDLSE